jgi:hypothetical protein
MDEGQDALRKDQGGVKELVRYTKSNGFSRHLHGSAVFHLAQKFCNGL